MEFISKYYGEPRLDVFLMGLLWVELMNIKLNDIIPNKDANLDQILIKLLEVAKTNEKIGPNHIITTKLFNIEQEANVLFDDIKLALDEILIMEESIKPDTE